ncbi:MAG: biopolymer transporter ExbD [Rikenellaceae bacterium]
MDKRKVQEINAGSMADIAFLLLIFFLVATTMNVDSGLQRVLPPMPDESNQEAIDVKKRNLMLVFVSQQDALMVAGERLDISQLKDKAKTFVTNVANTEDLPEKTVTTIDLIGDYPVSQGVISLQNDRGTSYGMYIQVQDELARAFAEIREELATVKFGKPFADLSEAERTAITKAVPLKISEAEPRNIGGQ